MIKSKTVFVIGAGASKEVGFPLGAELRHIISSKLNFNIDGSMGDKNIFKYLQMQRGKFNEYFEASQKIKNGILLADSIDDFIDFHQSDSITICGKVAIAASISEAERKSKLYVDPDNVYDKINFKAIGDTWYTKFYSLLVKQLQKSQLEKIFKNVTIVNFNYDRSLEHFLVCALVTHCDIAVNEANDLVSTLKVVRPYGSVGNYTTDRDSFLGFGNTRVINIENLKTYTEQVEDVIMLELVKEEIREAASVIFLGMAYHKNNMKLLESNAKDAHGMYGKKIYATRHGITDQDLPHICRHIMRLQPDKLSPAGKKVIPDNVKFAGTCNDLFSMYQKSLAEL